MAGRSPELTEEASGAPLAGLVVVDVGRFIAGPYCAFLLGALGATVVRVELPGGDVSWGAPPFLGPTGTRSTSGRQADEISLLHLKRGRGKRSVVIDYRQDEGRELLLRLLEQADVLVENFRPDALEPLGLDYPTVAARNPRLVYCALSGFGLSGPYRDLPSMDIAVQAMSGLMSRTGFVDGPPTKTGPTIGDQVPAVYAVTGVLAALRQRDATGRGQLVDVAMFDVLVSINWDDPLDYYDERGVPERTGNADPRGGPLNAYRAQDGWVALVVANNGHWATLVALMDRPDLLAVGATLADRMANLEQLDGAVAEWIAGRAARSTAEELRGAGIPAAAVATALELRDDPQVRHRGTLGSLVHPASPEVPSGYVGPTFPVRLSDHEARPAPTEVLGQSTDDVLGALLGLGAEELDNLHDRGLIGPPR